MATIQIPGVGELTEHSGHWEGTPSALGGAVLSIEANEITVEHEVRARIVCARWTSIVAQSLAFVEAQRSECQLEALSLENPNIFISTGLEWSIYFDTENEFEAVVGVEFRAESPFQLIIGD